MAEGSGRLMRAALRYLRKTRKRARPDRMNPHFTTHTIGGGHVRPGQPKGSGYHYRPGGEDFPDRRLVPGSEVTYPNGVYKAEPEFFDATLNPPAGAWKPKAGNSGVSTFFPDDWTPAQVDNAVSAQPERPAVREHRPDLPEWQADLLRWEEKWGRTHPYRGRLF